MTTPKDARTECSEQGLEPIEIKDEA